MANTNYIQNIQEILSNNLSQEAGALTSQGFQLIQQQLASYLVVLNNWNNIAGQRLNAFQDKNIEKPKQQYIVAKQLIHEDLGIEDLLKQGYLIIDEIREFFTGETIKYRVGVEYHGKLYEGFLTLEQIMSLAHVTPNWKGSINNLVKLRLQGGKGRIASMLEQVADDAEGHSTLWSSIRSYVGKKDNRGNVYEAYRVMVARQGSNRIPPSTWSAEEFDSVFKMVKQNTTSWTQGGDFLNEQIKFFSGNPSLTTLHTIKQTFEELYNIMQTFSGDNLVQGLQYYFQKDNITLQAASSIEPFVQEQVDQLLKSLKTAL